jgi:hypothetical protein
VPSPARRSDWSNGEAQAPLTQRGIVQSKRSARNRIDFLTLRTAAEDFVRFHSFNMPDKLFAHSRYSLAIALSALLHHCRKSTGMLRNRKLALPKSSLSSQNNKS